MQQTLSALRKRVGILYGEDIPLERAALVDWCATRFETWGKSAGMEVFKEEERDGRFTMMLGGKVIVIDMEFAVDRSDVQGLALKVVNIKTNFAGPNHGRTTLRVSW